jgi:protein-S-isoprenylcysteine O-methyltransferase Ste14
MDEKLSRWGIGPFFALCSLGYGAIIIVLNSYFNLHFEITLLPREVLVILAALLLAIGVPFFVLALFALHRAYHSDKLVTSGIFSLCRNPIYASWVVFLVPGIMLLRADWLGLTLPLFMYVVLRILVRKEEKYLERVFGEAYLDYRKKVMCVLPLSWLRKYT